MNKILVCTAFIIVVLFAGVIQVQDRRDLCRTFHRQQRYFINDNPEIFTDLAESDGHKDRARAGFSLADHLQDSATHSIIESQSWNLVVLQEKSDIPALIGV